MLKDISQENKVLLLKDLSARFPYKPICHRIWAAPVSNSPEESDEPLSSWDLELILTDVTIGSPVTIIDGKTYMVYNYDIKPYLRPLSSMTDEEREEYRKFSYYGAAGYRNGDFSEMIGVPSFEKIDFLNENHFDYRGLIEKGLAIKAPDDMYNSL